MLYATSGNSIVRYRVAPGSLTAAAGPDTVVTGLPMTGSHHSHNFVLDGSRLFVEQESGEPCGAEALGRHVGERLMHAAAELLRGVPRA